MKRIKMKMKKRSVSKNKRTHWKQREMAKCFCGSMKNNFEKKRMAKKKNKKQGHKKRTKQKEENKKNKRLNTKEGWKNMFKNKKGLPSGKKRWDEKELSGDIRWPWSPNKQPWRAHFLPTKAGPWWTGLQSNHNSRLSGIYVQATLCAHCHLHNFHVLTCCCPASHLSRNPQPRHHAPFPKMRKAKWLVIATLLLSVSQHYRQVLSAFNVRLACSRPKSRRRVCGSQHIDWVRKFPDSSLSPCIADNWWRLLGASLHAAHKLISAVHKGFEIIVQILTPCVAALITSVFFF